MNQSKRQLSRYGWRPADPPRRPVLFVNPRSGAGKAARAGLAERARDKGIEAVILASAMTRAISAGSARVARGRTSCKRQASGSNPLTGSSSEA
jgi:hypothetical protein